MNYFNCIKCGRLCPTKEENKKRFVCCYCKGEDKLNRCKLQDSIVEREEEDTISHEEVWKEDAGKKFDGGKPPISLISTIALVEEARVLDFGRQKYDAHNWRKGMQWSRLLDAALRHITSFNSGEDKDPETGLSHLAHARCCLGFLLDYELNHPEKDDRYKGDK